MLPFTEPFNSEPGSSEGWISRLATRRLAQRLQEQQAAERRRKRGVRLGRHHIQAGDHAANRDDLGRQLRGRQNAAVPWCAATGVTGSDLPDQITAGLPPILVSVFNTSTAFLLSEPELIAETFSIDAAQTLVWRDRRQRVVDPFIADHIPDGNWPGHKQVETGDVYVVLRAVSWPPTMSASRLDVTSSTRRTWAEAISAGA